MIKGKNDSIAEVWKRATREVQEFREVPDKLFPLIDFVGCCGDWYLPTVETIDDMKASLRPFVRVLGGYTLNNYYAGNVSIPANQTRLCLSAQFKGRRVYCYVEDLTRALAELMTITGGECRVETEEETVTRSKVICPVPVHV